MKNHSTIPSHLLPSALALGFAGLAAPVCGQVINEDYEFSAPNSTIGSNFGFSTAMDNGVLLVGACLDSSYGEDSGAAYLFDQATGTQLFQLIPNDIAAGDLFGWSVDIHNGIAVVGARGDDDNGAGSGSAYLFDVATGTQLTKLVASDGSANDGFGWSVAIQDGIVGVGAMQDGDNGSISGSAYLFYASSGLELGKLLPSDGAAWGRFGASMAMDAGLIVVGAERQNNTGAVYVFDTTTGMETTKFLADDATSGRYFGSSVDIDNGTIVIGDYMDSSTGWNEGSAYLFDLATETQIAKIFNDDIWSLGYFGRSVSISNGIACIGAPGYGTNGGNSGSAFLFDASTGTQIAKLLPSNGAASDYFGRSVAIQDEIVVVGATGIGAQSGYVFTIVPTEPCPADLNVDGVLDIIDVFDFLLAYNAGDSLADLTGDGILDISDVFAFLDSYNAGCP